MTLQIDTEAMRLVVAKAVLEQFATPEAREKLLLDAVKSFLEPRTEKVGSSWNEREIKRHPLLETMEGAVTEVARSLIKDMITANEFGMRDTLRGLIVKAVERATTGESADHLVAAMAGGIGNVFRIGSDR